MRAQDLAEGVELGGAQLREFLGHVRHRAVVLADLYSRTDFARRRGETRVGERLGDLVRLVRGGIRRMRGQRLDSGDDRVHPLAREIRDRGLPADLAQLAHGRTGEIVVGVAQAAAARGGQLILLGRAAPALLLPARGAGGPRLARFDERVQVAAHPGRAQAQPLADGRRGDGPLLEQQLDHRLAGVPLTHRRGGHDRTPGACLAPGVRLRVPQTHGFHNISVTEFLPAF